MLLNIFFRELGALGELGRLRELKVLGEFQHYFWRELQNVLPPFCTVYTKCYQKKPRHKGTARFLILMKPTLTGWNILEN